MESYHLVDKELVRTLHHVHEPGCAVKDAVEDGQITERRYDSYLRILRSSG